MYKGREVYPNAPLAMVTAEVSLNYEPTVKAVEVRDSIGRELRSSLPILEEQFIKEVRDSDGELKEVEYPQLRAIRADMQAAATISPVSLTLSMSGKAYGNFEDTFEPLLREVVFAFSKSVEQASITRIGLRFVDELRVPAPPETITEWGQWVNPALVACESIFVNSRHSGLRSSYHYHTDDAFVVFTWGTFNGTTVVNEDEPFWSPDFKPTRMFVLDIDSSRSFSKEFRRFDAAEIISTVCSLHEPLGEVFQNSITDKSRELFRVNRVNRVNRVEGGE